MMPGINLPQKPSLRPTPESPEEILAETKKELSWVQKSFSTAIPQKAEEAKKEPTDKRIEALSNLVDKVVRKYTKVLGHLLIYLPEDTVSKANHDFLAACVAIIQGLTLRLLEEKMGSAEKSEILDKITGLSQAVGQTLIKSLVEQLESIELANPTHILDHALMVIRSNSAYENLNIAVSYDKKAQQVLIPTIPGLFSRLIINLLSNAAKSVLQAKKQRGKETPSSQVDIVVRVKIEKQEVVIEIEDKGIGLDELFATFSPEEQQELLGMEQFIDYKIIIIAKERGGRRFKKGRGMGTEIIRQAIHSAPIKVLFQHPSKREKEGTLIQIRVPVLD